MGKRRKNRLYGGKNRDVRANSRKIKRKNKIDNSKTEGRSKDTTRMMVKREKKREKRKREEVEKRKGEEGEVKEEAKRNKSKRGE